LKLFVTGIGTDIGKTVVSAILAEALHASYWKPIQSGISPNTDSEFIKNHCSEKVNVLNERFLLKIPASPHFSAKQENINIKLTDFELPKTESHLIVEGAGGLFVPLNDRLDMVIDLIERFDIPVILVVSYYLGSINHTLLSLEVLKNRNINVFGIISSGDINSSSEQVIEKSLENTGIKYLFNVPKTTNLSKEFIQTQAKLLATILAYK
jgi:dethiobiotin synthetase